MKRLVSVVSIAALLTSAAAVRADDDGTFRVFWKEGLRFETADKQFRMKLGGRIHNDWVWWEGEDEVQAAIGEDIGDDTELRRARLYISGDLYERLIFKVDYDFTGGEPTAKDVFVGVTEIPALGTVRVGHFKEPFSLEEMMSSNDATFMERGLPNAFVPSRNTGFGLNRTFADERVTLGLGTFRDADEFGDAGGDNMQVSGRLTGLPLYANDGERLVHVGFSYRYQNPDGDVARVRQRPEVNSAPRFVDTGDLAIDDVSTYGFEGAAVFGPLSVQGEYILADFTSEDVEDPLLDADDPTFSGWYAYASWLLTGEHRSYKTDDGAFGGVKPHRNFLQGGPGAWEVALRYSTIDLDDGGAAGGELDDITAGVNWYLNPNARVMLNYVHADLDGSDAAHALMMRFQVHI